MSGRNARPTIITWYQSVFADLHAPLARSLRERHGIETILFCNRLGNLPDPARYDFDPSAFAEIIDIEPHLYPRPESELPTPAAFAATAARLESRITFSLVDILRVDRHVGIDFVTGADFYRSHFGEVMSWRQKLDIVARLCGFFDALLDRVDAVAIMAPPGDIGRASLVAVAEGRGVPLQLLVQARTGRRFFLARDRHSWPFGLEAAYQRRLAELPAGAAAVPPETSQSAKIYMSGIGERGSFLGLARALKQSLRREVGRRLKRREIINREYFFRDRLRIDLFQWRFARHIQREAPRFERLPEQQPFVFFPLTVEPEMTLMSEAQMCDNQLTALDWLAKTLPSGWLLLVKEHPSATAPRPSGFWERVRLYPNVEVLAALEPGETVALKAHAVATINGTLGLQAATAGVPLITFHPRYIGTLLPHAFLCRSYEDTQQAMRRLRDEALPPLAERRRAAAALHAALDDLCYPLEDRNLLRGVSGGENVAAEQVAIIADAYARLLVERPADTWMRPQSEARAALAESAR